jgi:PAS domain-containing protein
MIDGALLDGDRLVAAGIDPGAVRAVTDGMSEGLLTLDVDDRLTYANVAAEDLATGETVRHELLAA